MTTYHSEKFHFWQQQKADPTGMMLNIDALEFDKLEKSEVIRYLPSLESKQVLELGAGIGRFTNHFASIANHVVAVDFVEKFIQANQKRNANFSNITYHIQDG